MDSIQFTSLHSEIHLLAGELLFNGNLSIPQSLAVQFETSNALEFQNNVNNLNQSIQNGLNVDRNVSNLITNILQSPNTLLDFQNHSQMVDISGTVVSPMNSTILTNSIHTKLDSLYYVISNQSTVALTQVQSVYVSEKGMNSIQLEVKMKDNIDIILNDIQFRSKIHSSTSQFVAHEAYTYQYIPKVIKENYPTAVAKALTQTTFTSQVTLLNDYEIGTHSNGMSLTAFFTMIFTLAFLLVLLVRVNFSKRHRPYVTYSENYTTDVYQNTLDSKTLDFFVAYPIDSIKSKNILVSTGTLPNFERVGSKTSMIHPRILPDFDSFGFYEPIVEINDMLVDTGTQLITFQTTVECNIQCNQSLIPRLLDTTLNAIMANDQLPPPAFHSIDSSNEHLECFYQVRIVTFEENNPNLAIGFVTGLYPPFRLPGLCDKSIAFHCQDSTVRFCGETVPFPEIEIYEGDVLGIGYYLQPPTEIDSNPDSTFKNVHFYFTFEKKRYEREFVLENMDTGMIHPSIGSRSDCEVEVVFGPLYTSFAPETLY
ncbi:hypothetical protein HDV02_001396 [Globomyces sp. JEL0801]|nr:hypothetical protein HDV02_001396 [Globomyces sp. JEL0801]